MRALAAAARRGNLISSRSRFCGRAEFAGMKPAEGWTVIVPCTVVVVVEVLT